MADIIELENYKYYTYSSRGFDFGYSHTVILMYSADGYIGAVFFQKSDEGLKPATKSSGGIYSLYYSYADLPQIIDMLRNESPVYLIYNGEKNSRLSTSSEPVGEGEA